MRKMIARFGILFILIINPSCNGHKFQTILACSKVGSVVKCGNYDLNIQKFTSNLEVYPDSIEQYSFIIPQKEFLLKLKPDLLDLRLIKKKKKSLHNTETDGFRKVKLIYEFN